MRTVVRDHFFVVCAKGIANNFCLLYFVCVTCYKKKNVWRGGKKNVKGKW